MTTALPTSVPTTLTLPAELTIYTATQTRAAWLGWLAEVVADTPEGGTCQADAAAVDEVDAAGVQLLISLGNALQAQQRVLQLVQASQPLRQACEALGMDSLLAATPDAVPTP